jgi:hypothetical protein
MNSARVSAVLTAVALHLQLPGDGTQTNWYKATRVDRNACAAAADLELPRGTKIKAEDQDAEEDQTGERP